MRKIGKRASVQMICGCRWKWMRQRPTEMAIELAKHGCDVTFLLGDASEPEGVYKFGKGSVHVTTTLKRSCDILWVSYGGAWEFMGNIRYKMLIFDNLDSPFGIKDWEHGEREIFKRAHLVLCSSGRLYRQKCAWAQELDTPPQILYVPNACRILPEPTYIPHEFDRIPYHPKYGRAVFLGALATWVNWRYLLCLADHGVPVVVIGPEFSSRLRRCKNVYYINTIDYEDIPAYLAQCSVGLIPFNQDDEVAQCADPIKTYQYLAAGLPVLGSGIEELYRERFDGVVVTESFAQHWPKAYKEALGISPELCKRIARENTWEKRFETIKPYIWK